MPNNVPDAVICDACGSLCVVCAECMERERVEMEPEIARLRALLAEREAELSNLWDVLARIDKTLRVPAAEYVPAIGNVFNIIDIIDTELAGALKAAAAKAREAPDAD